MVYNLFWRENHVITIYGLGETRILAKVVSINQTAPLIQLGGYDRTD